ncbi:AraC family transcriptional regulator [Arsenicibacter rosenii]|uniref:AraC family transcriptional regulator n=1 Tax=Arsenicibacter rosenii TaxID=1750698 RepID=A0A1S2VDR4_9BACT|nr:AraC family transcriptional regulator [Arsenicibacter rosenii]OIN56048.1 AraC family transcriptional regulator [Arsenicibacter rosenii]
MEFLGKNNEFLQIQVLKNNTTITYDKSLEFPLIFIWTKDKCSEIIHEGRKYILPINTIICLTEFHELTVNNELETRQIKFNKEFYCVLNHDKEVGCKGILFYGVNQIPMLTIPDDKIEQFEIIWKIFQTELESKDDLQLDMLQSILKRFIILCTRIYKAQNNLHQQSSTEVNIIREFNFLVEKNFRTKHTVKEYADILNKSPKTLSNLFSALSEKTPLQIIHERKILEAKRLLKYTDKSIKEIAYDIGFQDIHTFSRFFKKMEKMSPSSFKCSSAGNIANL